MKYVKVFGIERTGTSYVQAMITQNLVDTRSLSNGFGWKHMEPWDVENWLANHKESSKFFQDIYKENRKNGIGAVIVIKDPYHWYSSIERYANRTPGYKPFNPQEQCRRFNRLYKAWNEELLVKGHPFFTKVMVIRYEDLLMDPARVLGQVARMMGTRVKTPIKVVNKVENSNPFNEKRKQHYLHKVAIPRNVKNIINNNISTEIFKLYNYERRAGCCGGSRI